MFVFIDGAIAPTVAGILINQVSLYSDEYSYVKHIEVTQKKSD